jgi:hypothetical protein
MKNVLDNNAEYVGILLTPFTCIMEVSSVNFGRVIGYRRLQNGKYINIQF